MIQETGLNNCFNTLIDSLTNTADNQKTGDYVGDDGLLYCGICHTRKQSRAVIPSMGIDRIVNCLCKCENERKLREEEEIRSMKHREEIARRKRESFPDWELSKFTFEKDDKANARITEAMKRYCFNFGKFKEEGKGLILYGGVETGKTFIACCVANDLIDQGYNVLATNFSRIVNTVWNTEDKQGYFDKLNSYDLLVIDDLGAERQSEYMQEIIFNVIDSRDRAGLPMIITTNLTLDELKAPADLARQRIYSRVLKICFPVEVAGIQRRREIVKRDYQPMKELLGL